MTKNIYVIAALITTYYLFQLQCILDYERIAKGLIHEIKLEKLDVNQVNYNTFLAYAAMRQVGVKVELA